MDRVRTRRRRYKESSVVLSVIRKIIHRLRIKTNVLVDGILRCTLHLSSAAELGLLCILSCWLERTEARAIIRTLAEVGRIR